MPMAAASAPAAAADCATEQMPQMRGTNTSASSGALPCRICSKPRYSERAHPGRVDAAVGDLEDDFEIALDAVERADNQSTHGSPHGFFAGRGQRMTWSALAFWRTRAGVADFDSAASATNQALGMSSGRPMGMPATFGVWANGWPGSSKPGSVQLMQA